jgi:hypothetical protein
MDSTLKAVITVLLPMGATWWIVSQNTKHRALKYFLGVVVFFGLGYLLRKFIPSAD